MDMEGIEDIEGIFEPDRTKVANSVLKHVFLFSVFTLPPFFQFAS
jgi:hypothetical protein